MTKAHRTSGFTLIEMMATLTVAAVLMTIGFPSLAGVAERNRAASEANGLLSLITLTRTEAIKRNRRVALCRSVDGQSCAGGADADWSDGAIAFVDLDCNGTRAAGNVTTDCHGMTIAPAPEPVLRAELPLSGASQILASASLAEGLAYRSSGLSNADAGRFLIRPGTDFRSWRKVVLNVAGRPYVARCANAHCS